MASVIVIAKFPGTNDEQKEPIFKKLTAMNWKRHLEPGSDELEEKVERLFDPGTMEDEISVWVTQVGENNHEYSIEMATRDFIQASLPYNDPVLLLHYGPIEPVFY